jgi:uncharacterized glyoxalase superfamily protein PhnB
MKLTGLTASLFTSQIDRALAFYRDVLGFAVKQSVPDQAPFVFVWLERDNVNVFLNDEALTRKEAPDSSWLTVGQSGVTLFIVMEGIASLWATVKDKARVVMPLKDQWYGMSEFSIQDADGYVLTFAEERKR